jgi:hypothetical protein
MSLESTWTAQKFFCPKCGRIYAVPTTLGKLAQVAPLASIGIFAVSLLSLERGGAAEHAAEVFEHLGD